MYEKVKGDEAASKMMGEEAVLPASTSVQNPVSAVQPPVCCREGSQSRRRMGMWAATEISWWKATLLALCSAGKLWAARRQGDGGTLQGATQAVSHPAVAQDWNVNSSTDVDLSPKTRGKSTYATLQNNPAQSFCWICGFCHSFMSRAR